MIESYESLIIEGLSCYLNRDDFPVDNLPQTRVWHSPPQDTSNSVHTITVLVLELNAMLMRRNHEKSMRRVILFSHLGFWVCVVSLKHYFSTASTPWSLPLSLSQISRAKPSLAEIIEAM